MGVRLYNTATGLFTSVDPVAGGNTTDYVYPQDPINGYDLDGKAAKGNRTAFWAPLLRLLAQLIKAASKAGRKNAPKVVKAPKARTYHNITKRKSVVNIGTNVTRREFAKQLRRSGWKYHRSKSGKAKIYMKNGAKYSLRKRNSSGHPGWTAEYTPRGKSKATVKYRLGYRR